MASSSYKDRTVAASKALDELIVIMDDEGANWTDLKGLLANISEGLNPTIHECENDDCVMNTWTGGDDVCPLCKDGGKIKGRSAK